MNQKTIYIEGMHCKSCANLIKLELLKLEGIKNVNIDLNTKKATIEYEKNLNNNKIKSIIEGLGYKMNE